MPHRLNDRVVLPIHVRVRGLMQRHVESTKEMRQREMELRVRQAVGVPTGPLVFILYIMVDWG